MPDQQNHGRVGWIVKESKVAEDGKISLLSSEDIAAFSEDIAAFRVGIVAS